MHFNYTTMGGCRPYGPPSSLNCGLIFKIYNHHTTLNSYMILRVTRLLLILEKGNYALIHIKHKIINDHNPLHPSSKEWLQDCLPLKTYILKRTIQSYIQRTLFFMLFSCKSFKLKREESLYQAKTFWTSFTLSSIHLTIRYELKERQSYRFLFKY